MHKCRQGRRVVWGEIMRALVEKLEIVAGEMNRQKQCNSVSTAL